MGITEAELRGVYIENIALSLSMIEKQLTVKNQIDIFDRLYNMGEITRGVYLVCIKELLPDGLK